MKTIKRMGAIVLLFIAAVTASAKTVYLSPKGNDKAEGSLAHPMATLPAAYKKIAGGDTLCFRGGTYVVTDRQVMKKVGSYAYVFALEKGGSSERRTCIMGYPGERPVFDFSALQLDGRHRFAAFYLGADYLHLLNFDIVGVPVRVKGHTQSECVAARKGSYCIVENLAMHDNMAIGYYQVAGRHNLVLNCDAYNNYDNYSEGAYGGNVDGFGCHVKSVDEVGNVFRGCRAWRNSDDGFDLIKCDAPVEIDHCFALFNGYQPTADASDVTTFNKAGDGNGFKAGGWGMKPRVMAHPDQSPQHYIHHCVAYGNKANGIYANHHLGGNRWEYNTSACNRRDNYNMVNRRAWGEHDNVDVPGYGHLLTNNVSWQPGRYHLGDCDSSSCVLINNAFDASQCKASSFLSVDPSTLLVPRNALGALPCIPFVLPQQQSPLYEQRCGWRLCAPSALNVSEWQDHWCVESESPDYRIIFFGDTCEIFAPKGLTFWRKEKLDRGVTIEYDACVLPPRVSDMNCFWMASDPKAEDIWQRQAWRSGIFARCYSLQLYYVGYGGNHNTTTRFRRYHGDEQGVTDVASRPAVIREFTDADHLLESRRWYHIRITTSLDGRTRYYVDGACLIDYLDNRPLDSGWFGFRTTLSTTRIANFRCY